MDCQLFETRVVSTWKELKEELDRFPPGWAFRGQADATWELQTSLERIGGNLEQRILALVEADLPKFSDQADQVLGATSASDVDISAYIRDCVPQFISQHTDVVKDLEARAINMFRAKAHHYLSCNANPATLLEWVALMQHHGAPTRLLDWTYSPYVASFFALEDARATCAIWAVDVQWLLHQGPGLLQRAGVSMPVAGPTVAPGSPRFFELVFSHSTPGVFPVVPDRLNERLTMQQGLFLAFGNPKISFMSNLMELGESLRGHIWKIQAPQGIVGEALADLHRMNVSRATLFPGIDGFAQSIRHQLLIESDMRWMNTLLNKLFGSREFLAGAFMTALTMLPNVEAMADIVGDKGLVSLEEAAMVKEWLRDRRGELGRLLGTSGTDSAGE